MQRVIVTGSTGLIAKKFFSENNNSFDLSTIKRLQKSLITS